MIIMTYGVTRSRFVNKSWKQDKIKHERKNIITVNCFENNYEELVETTSIQ